MNRIKYNFYNKQPRYISIEMWLHICKPLFELGFNRYFRGVYKPKLGRHRRSMRRIDMALLPGDTAHYTFNRGAKPIGRKKHNKWLYMPKRILLGGNN